jgi:hypothetical protein
MALQYKYKTVEQQSVPIYSHMQGNNLELQRPEYNKKFATIEKENK